MRTFLGVVAALAAIGGLAFGAGPAAAQRSEIYASAPPSGGPPLAVGGYDTVAYHTQGGPVEGRPEFAATWKGATWRFASKANLDAFLAAPDKYAPQYGGHCAFAAASGSRAPGDPKVWSIVNGRLFLNLSPGVQTLWNKDRAGFIARADKEWPRLAK